MMRNPPILTTIEDNEDVAAERAAAQARRHASEVVRDHLETHTSLNPGASSDYVTWLATLHPENAEITIDQRFFVPGNPWWTIYEDTKYHGGILPTATAIPVVVEEETPPSPGSAVYNNDLEQQQQQQFAATTTTSSSTTGQQKHATTSGSSNGPPFYLVCSPLSILSGALIAVHSLLGTFLCEFFALVLCHYPAAMFYKIAQTCCSPPGPFTLLPHSIGMLIYSCLAVSDSLLLLISVLIVEVMASVGYIIQLCIGGILMGKFWHQYMRRSCHGIRVMSRQLSATTPSRHFIFTCCTPNQHTMDQQNLTADVVDVTTTASAAASAAFESPPTVTAVEHVVTSPSNVNMSHPFKE